ncbi:MAG: helix-hairpin-helix domain-containing protein [Prevotellaceae bacterium]|nr:helix-hairpin-helix domain-containing protein [Prevotellaceae bacterium]
MPRTLRLLTLASSLLFAAAALAQDYSLEDFISELQDDERGDYPEWTAQLEELAYLNAHPIDINSATREDFRKIPLLTDSQIEDIHTYIFLNGSMRSLSELMAIESLNYATRRYLSLFFYASDKLPERKDTVNARNLLTRAEHELTARLDIPLYYREGYMHSPANGGYNGSPLYNRVQYRLQSMNHLLLGLSGEKDAGEPFTKPLGYDSYGGYLGLKDLKCLRTLIVGDYKLGFGEGLVVNNGFSLGKAYASTPSRGIRANNAADEYSYFRGAALALRLRNVETTVWVSCRSLDATLNSDGDAQTIITNGYHRTDNELSKKGNLRSLLTGGDISWQARGFQLGATGYYQHFSLPLAPGTAAYRAYYPRGNKFGVLGAHYGYGNRWVVFSGETAYSTERGGVGMVDKLVWTVSQGYKLTGLVRYYQKQYYSFYASSISENSRAQNETGGMLKLDAQPLRNWTLLAYADFFRNPWPRYQMTHSSQGQDFLVSSEWRLNARHQLSLRYQLKRKESSDVMQANHRIRLRYTALPTSSLRLQSILTLHALEGEAGASLTQNMRCKFKRKGNTVAAALSYFHTPGYSTRVYVSEPALRSSYSSATLFGEGLRLAATVACALWGGLLTMEAKYGCTCYLDRAEQGSAMQAIRSRWKNDIQLQIRINV